MNGKIPFMVNNGWFISMVGMGMMVFPVFLHQMILDVHAYGGIFTKMGQELCFALGHGAKGYGIGIHFRQWYFGIDFLIVTICVNTQRS
jgi:hypothetical protein